MVGSLRFAHSVWKTLSSSPSNGLFFSFILTTSLRSSRRLHSTSLLDDLHQSQGPMGLPPLATLGKIRFLTHVWEGHMDLIDNCNPPAPSLPSGDSPWALHPALHHIFADLDTQPTYVCAWVCVRDGQRRETPDEEHILKPSSHPHVFLF